MGDWIGTAGGVVGLVVALGAVVTYLRNAADKGTISTLEKNSEALSERVDLLEKSEARLKEEARLIEAAHRLEIGKLTVRIEALERENASLLEQRPSAEAIADLTTMVQRHDTDMKQLLSEAKT